MRMPGGAFKAPKPMVKQLATILPDLASVSSPPHLFIWQYGELLWGLKSNTEEKRERGFFSLTSYEYRVQSTAQPPSLPSWLHRVASGQTGRSRIAHAERNIFSELPLR